TADEFSILGPQFNGAEMWTIDKSDLIQGAASPHFVHFANLMIDDQQTVAPQPALSTGRPNAEYFLSSLDFDGTGDNRIGGGARSARAGRRRCPASSAAPRRTPSRRRPRRRAPGASWTPATTGCRRRSSSAARSGVS